MATTVHGKWEWFPISLNDRKKDIEEKAQAAAGTADKELFKRAVYVIRMKRFFHIQYEKKPSPVLYIGEAAAVQRIVQHQKWLASFGALAGSVPIEVAIRAPRFRRDENAYRELEAFLLKKFRERHGELPLRNKINESLKYDHAYADKAWTEVFKSGQGAMYHWALEPLPNNGFSMKGKRKQATALIAAVTQDWLRDVVTFARATGARMSEIPGIAVVPGKRTRAYRLARR